MTATVINRLHGSPFDRGQMDSYYRRRRQPHKIVPGDNGRPATRYVYDLTPEEVEEYNTGYTANEQEGDKKDYGH